MKHLALGLLLSTICCNAIAVEAREVNRSRAVQLAAEARVEWKQGKLQDALDLYSHAAATHPAAGIYFERARVRFELNDFEKTVSDCTLALALLDSYSAESHSKKPDLFVHVEYELEKDELALSDSSKEEGIEAESLAALCEGDHSGVAQGAYQEAAAYNLRGLAEFKLERNDEAMADLSKAIELGIRFPSTTYVRGQARMEIGDYQQAVFDFNETIALDAYVIESHLLRGKARLEMEQYALADSDFSFVISYLTDPESIAGVLVLRGEARSQMRQYNHALADLTDALSKRDNLALVWINRGRVWMEMGKHSQALEDFNRAIEIAPADPAGYLARFCCLWEMSETADALSDIEKAISLESQTAEFYLFRGECHYKLKDISAARRDFEEALSRDPNLAEAKQRLQELKQKEFDVDAN